MAFDKNFEINSQMTVNREKKIKLFNLYLETYITFNMKLTLYFLYPYYTIFTE